MFTETYTITYYVSLVQQLEALLSRCAGDFNNERVEEDEEEQELQDVIECLHDWLVEVGTA